MHTLSYWWGYWDGEEGRESAYSLLLAACQVYDADNYRDGYARGVLARTEQETV